MSFCACQADEEENSVRADLVQARALNALAEALPGQAMAGKKDLCAVEGGEGGWMDGEEGDGVGEEQGKLKAVVRGTGCTRTARFERARQRFLSATCAAGEGEWSCGATIRTF